MIAFLATAGAIAVLALGIALRPLWRRGGEAVGSFPTSRELNVSVYRDQLRELDADLRAGTLAKDDYERARRELEVRLLRDVDAAEAPAAPAPRRPAWIALAGAGAVPVLALIVYLATGTPGAVDPRARETGGMGMRDIEAMVQRLSDRMAQNPDDVEGWKMLGRSYTVLGRFPEAAKAYAQAAARAPRDPGVLVDLADAIAMARGQSMAGEPDELVQRALQIDPNHLKALALAGTSAFDRQDYRGAARYWERMLPLLPADSEDRRTVQANVDEARALARKGKPAPARGVSGTVRLAPALASRVSPDDTVFIFARAAEGSPLPLAVLRKRVRDLPAAFSLDDSMAMTPGARLSLFPRIVVGARVSKSGNANPQPGDLQGLSGVVAANAQGVSVLIDREVPAR